MLYTSDNIQKTQNKLRKHNIPFKMVPFIRFGEPDTQAFRIEENELPFFAACWIMEKNQKG